MLIWVRVKIMAAVVGLDDQIVHSIDFLNATESLLFHHLGALNNVKAEEVVWENFVNGWHLHTGKVWTVNDGNVQ